MNEWGIWIEDRGVYTGWFGFAAGDRLIPMRFSEAEARGHAEKDPKFSARIVPLDQYELPWNEKIWKESKK